MVASDAVMPTSGTRPRAVRSRASASISDSPLPKRLILRWTICRVAKPWRPEERDDLIVEHPLHLVRDAGQAGEPGPADLHGDSRRGADRVRQRLGAFGKQGLDPVPLGHHAVPPGEHRLDRSSDAASSTRPTPATAASASRVRSSWVGPRPPLVRIRSARPIAVLKTAMFSARSSPSAEWKWTGDSESSERLAEPLAVRVERLAADQFAADRDDFRLHPVRPSRFRPRCSQEDPSLTAETNPSRQEHPVSIETSPLDR